MSSSSPQFPPVSPPWGEPASRMPQALQPCPPSVPRVPPLSLKRGKEIQSARHAVTALDGCPPGWPREVRGTGGNGGTNARGYGSACFFWYPQFLYSGERGTARVFNGAARTGR